MKYCDICSQPQSTRWIMNETDDNKLICDKCREISDCEAVGNTLMKTVRERAENVQSAWLEGCEYVAIVSWLDQKNLRIRCLEQQIAHLVEKVSK